MRFSIRAIAAALAIVALLVALALPANSDLLYVVLAAACLLTVLLQAGRVFRTFAASAQSVSLLSVLPSRAPPLR
jgi:hypothetical protein